jgi:hypothetical protein
MKSSKIALTRSTSATPACKFFKFGKLNFKKNRKFFIKALADDDLQEQEPVDAYAGHHDLDDYLPFPVNLLDATRLATELQPDYRLAIECEILQLVDSGATMHIVPDYIANAMVAPVPPPAPSVPEIDLDDFLFDDDEPFELPPDGPAAWVAPAAPRPPAPAVPVLDLDDAFLFGVNEPVEPPPGGPSG